MLFVQVKRDDIARRRTETFAMKTIYFYNWTILKS